MHLIYHGKMGPHGRQTMPPTSSTSTTTTTQKRRKKRKKREGERWKKEEEKMKRKKKPNSTEQTRHARKKTAGAQEQQANKQQLLGRVVTNLWQCIDDNSCLTALTVVQHSCLYPTMLHFAGVTIWRPTSGRAMSQLLCLPFSDNALFCRCYHLTTTSVW